MTTCQCRSQIRYVQNAVTQIKPRELQLTGHAMAGDVLPTGYKRIRTYAH